MAAAGAPAAQQAPVQGSMQSKVPCGMGAAVTEVLAAGQPQEAQQPEQGGREKAHRRFCPDEVAPVRPLQRKTGRQRRVPLGLSHERRITRLRLGPEKGGVCEVGGEDIDARLQESSHSESNLPGCHAW
jgi:hypothetical protein